MKFEIRKSCVPRDRPWLVYRTNGSMHEPGSAYARQVEAEFPHWIDAVGYVQFQFRVKTQRIPII